MTLGDLEIETSPSALPEHEPGEPAVRSPWKVAGLLAAFVVGLSACLLAPLTLICGLSLAMVRSESFSSSLVLQIVSLAVVGVGLGLPLAWQAFAGLGRKPSRRFEPSTGWRLVLVLLYLLALAGGQTVLSLQLAPTWTLPPFHAMALALPPLLFLWQAAALAKEPHFTWRQFWGGLGGGAFGSLALAFIVEMTLLTIGIAVVTVVMAGTPGWVELLRRLNPTPGGLTADPELVRSLLRNPIVVAVLLVGVALIVPLIEEAAKSLVPALAGALHKPSAAYMFLWGVASGAGFAIVEGMLNGGLDTGQWSAVALLRIGSSAMHCLTAGLAGWGWAKVWMQRKWLYLLVMYGLAVVVHGVWNATSIGLAIAAGALDSGMVQDVLAAAMVSLLVFLTIGMIVALMVLAKRLSSPGRKSW